ncbi:MAG: hypothetical protein ACRCZF_07340, partial [Gemmataceae bacterium]
MTPEEHAAPDTPLTIAGWSPNRIALWLMASALAFLAYAPAYLGAFRPPPLFVTDFIQEWLSAKNYQSGRPVYSPQREVVGLYLPVDPARAQGMLPWNAHPPGSVLVSLPFAHLEYENAQLLWNLLT